MNIERATLFFYNTIHPLFFCKCDLVRSIRIENSCPVIKSKRFNILLSWDFDNILIFMVKLQFMIKFGWF